MKSIHDNNVYSIEIQCEKDTIILHTEYKGDSSEFTDVQFSGVVGHHFEHILNGNILFDIEEWEPHSFYKEFNTELNTYQRYGLSLAFGNSQEFCDRISKGDLKAYVIGSSYGLSGWILATRMEILQRDDKYGA